MTNNNYFIPSITDFKVGYECEWKMNKENAVCYPSKPKINDWQPIKLTIEDFSDHDLASEFHNITNYYNEFRTPYLTKEQIEDEGWTFLNYKDKKECNELLFKRRIIREGQFTLNLFLNYYKNDSRIRIDSDIRGCLFDGKIKCVNEFRTLLTFLNLR